jgi:hypothetical protein
MLEDIKPKVAQKLLKVFLDADLHYHLSGMPHDQYLYKQAYRHLGQTRRMLIKVANLGHDGAKRWMGYFIESMSEEL